MKGMSWKEIPAMLALALLVLFTVDRSIQYRRENAPTSEYFEVHQVVVPDFIEGEDPVITYDRTIRKPFRGYFSAEVQRNGTLSAVHGCTGSSWVNYSPEKKLPPGGLTLSWFLWKEPGECQLKEGAYRLYACWDVYRDQASVRHECASSRLFNVWAHKEEER